MSATSIPNGTFDSFKSTNLRKTSITGQPRQQASLGEIPISEASPHKTIFAPKKEISRSTSSTSLSPENQEACLEMLQSKWEVLFQLCNQRDNKGNSLLAGEERSALITKIDPLLEEYKKLVQELPKLEQKEADIQVCQLSQKIEKLILDFNKKVSHKDIHPPQTSPSISRLESNQQISISSEKKAKLLSELDDTLNDETQFPLPTNLKELSEQSYNQGRDGTSSNPPSSWYKPPFTQESSLGAIHYSSPSLSSHTITAGIKDPTPSPPESVVGQVTNFSKNEEEEMIRSLEQAHTKLKEKEAQLLADLTKQKEALKAQRGFRANSKGFDPTSELPTHALIEDLSQTIPPRQDLTSSSPLLARSEALQQETQKLQREIAAYQKKRPLSQKTGSLLSKGTSPTSTKSHFYDSLEEKVTDLSRQESQQTSQLLQSIGSITTAMQRVQDNKTAWTPIIKLLHGISNAMNGTAPSNKNNLDKQRKKIDQAKKASAAYLYLLEALKEGSATPTQIAKDMEKRLSHPTPIFVPYPHHNQTTLDALLKKYLTKEQQPLSPPH